MLKWENLVEEYPGGIRITFETFLKFEIITKWNVIKN